MTDTVIMINGGIPQSKHVVACAKALRYDVRKINPKRATREIVRVLLPQGHPQDAEFFEKADCFIRENDAQYLYIENKLRSFLATEPVLDEEESRPSKVAILVNIDPSLAETLKDEFGAFWISIQDGSSDKFDFSFSEKDIDVQVERILAQLTK